MNVSNYKKNFLKDLIYLAHTKPVSKQIIKGLFRFALEPLLEAQNQKAVVLIRMFDTTESEGVLKRLEFNQAEVYSFSQNINAENLEREPIWGDTEFLVILSPRYSVALLWDYSTEEIKDTSCVYFLLNSREVNNVVRIISANSKIDLNRYTVEFTPERRSNELLNKAVHKFIDYANSFAQEASLSKAENNILESNEEVLKKYEYICDRAGMISHEIRNHLSVIDLYSKIIQKRTKGITNADVKNSIDNAVNSITKSKELISKMLFELKTIQSADVLPIKITEFFETLKSLVQPKVEEKQAKLNICISNDCRILADESKLLNVLINLIYNALDFVDKDGKIDISTHIEGENTLKITVADNGSGIPEELRSKIFEKGFTSKKTGSGLGLYISKLAMQEQYGDLILKETQNSGTVFELLIPMI